MESTDAMRVLLACAIICRVIAARSLSVRSAGVITVAPRLDSDCRAGLGRVPNTKRTFAPSVDGNHVSFYKNNK